MSPLITLQDELAEEEKVLRNEQEWFLKTQVKPSLDAIQKSLLACQEAVRLQDDAKGALTLAISSTNNDTLKGFVTLAGSFIVKGDLTVKLPKLPVVKTAIHSNVPSNASVPVASLPSNTTSSTAPNSVSTSSVVADIPIKDLALTTLEGSDTSKGDLQSSQSTEQSQSQPGQDSTSNESNSSTAPKASASGVTLDGSALPPPPPVNTHQLLSSYRPPGHLTQPYLLEQLKDVQNHTAQAIFRLEDYWSRSNNDALARFLKKDGNVVSETDESTSDPVTAQEIKEATRPLKTLLELIERHLRASIEAMARPKKEKLYPFRVCDPKIFSPALSEDFVIEFYVRDSRLVCAAYALQLTSGSNSTAAGGLTGYLQQALPGSSTPASQHTPQFTRAQSSSSSSSTFTASKPPLDGHAHSYHGDLTAKSGHTTPRPPSPVHHDGPSTQPSHPPSSQQPNNGNGVNKSPPSHHHHHHNQEHIQATGPPPNEAVTLPQSNKIGQISKGGINKYRGKVATTIEDKIVQVESPKLAEISTRLMQAEGLCRRLLQFLQLQESVAVTPFCHN